jgi:hypothetical protein
MSESDPQFMFLKPVDLTEALCSSSSWGFGSKKRWVVKMLINFVESGAIAIKANASGSESCRSQPDCIYP